MKNILKKHLKGNYDIYDSCIYYDYSEDVNVDALSEDWLKNRTSYIYKVGVLCAIDSNKCDWVHVVIGVQRNEFSEPEIKGALYFDKGENDDMGRVVERAFNLMQIAHPAFEV